MQHDYATRHYRDVNLAERTHGRVTAHDAPDGGVTYQISFTADTSTVQIGLVGLSRAALVELRDALTDVLVLTEAPAFGRQDG